SRKTTICGPSLGVGALRPAGAPGTTGGGAPPATPVAAWAGPGPDSTRPASERPSGDNAMPLAAAAAASSTSAATTHFEIRDMVIPRLEETRPMHTGHSPRVAGCASSTSNNRWSPSTGRRADTAATRHGRLYTAHS